MKLIEWPAFGRVGSALLFAALSSGTTQAANDKPFDGVTLRVATYGGPWKDGLQSLVGAEMEKLGAKVEFFTGPPTYISRS